MRIILGTDGSPAAEIAGRLVAERTWPTGTRVSVVSVARPLVDLSGMAAVASDRAGADGAGAQTIAEGMTDTLRAAGLTADADVAVGEPAAVLMERADVLMADLIVVGNRGRGPIASAVLGSVSASLVDHAPCPVLVARAPSLSRMLMATDGTQSSMSIPRVLDAWGPAFRGLPVEVVSVAERVDFVTPWVAEPERDGEVVDHERIAAEVADELMALGWHAAAIARVGEPGREIVKAGDEWHADLIVTGSRGIGTLRRILAGSVAHDVLLHAHSSVLVVRGGVPSAVRAPVFAAGAMALG